MLRIRYKLEREENQKVVRIDANLDTELIKWLDSAEAKEAGFHSKAPVINAAVRDFLEKYKKTRFGHINFQDNLIRLIDNDKPKGTPFIDIYLKSDMIVCDSCKSKNCIHVEQCWKNDKITRVLKKKGILRVSVD